MNPTSINQTPESTQGDQVAVTQHGSLALRSDVNIQTGISIYMVKPAVLQFENGTLTLTTAEGETIFSETIVSVKKIKNWGEFLYIWIGRKSYTINFANAKKLKNELGVGFVANTIAGQAGNTVMMAQAASREAESEADIAGWIALFNNYGIQAKQRRLYRSKVTWAVVVTVLLLAFIRASA